MKRLVLLAFIAPSAHIMCAESNDYGQALNSICDVKLGMTDDAVAKILGAEPVKCERCQDGERYLFADKYCDSRVELFFYKRIVYKISYRDKDRNADEIIAIYREAFKSDGRLSPSTPYIDSIIWKNHDYIVRVDYGSHDKKIESIHLMDRKYICRTTSKMEMNRLQGLIGEPACHELYNR